MRIAHVLRRISFGDWGGTEQVVWNIAKAQREAGHEVRLFATTALWNSLKLLSLRGDSEVRSSGDFSSSLQDSKTPSCESKAGKIHGYFETVDGIEILRFKPIYPWWPMPRSLVDELDRKGGNPFVPGLGRALREWKPDVIHCHAMARIAELCLRAKEEVRRKKEEVRCVVSLHGGGANVPTAEAKSLKAPTRGRLPWGKMIDYALGWTRRIPEDFDGIVCVGEDEYEKYRAKHPHVMYLPNGVDCRLFERMTGESSDARRGSSPAACTSKTHVSLLCVARIDRQKNQMALVEWLGRNPAGSVRLVGPVTQPDYRAELERRAAELGVTDRLAFVGALKPGSPELISEYANADLFVLPSRHEPFGIVVLEAWAAGLPVVASDVGGLGRLCAAHPGAAVTFPADDSAALDAAVSAALENAQKIAGSGLSAAKEYDWPRLSARLVDFYSEICHNTKS